MASDADRLRLALSEAVLKIAGTFPTMGGGKDPDHETNIIAATVARGPLVFAAGVPVEEVVQTVFLEAARYVVNEVGQEMKPLIAQVAAAAEAGAVRTR